MTIVSSFLLAIEHYEAGILIRVKNEIKITLNIQSMDLNPRVPSTLKEQYPLRGKYY